MQRAAKSTVAVPRTEAYIGVGEVRMRGCTKARLNFTEVYDSTRKARKDRGHRMATEIERTAWGALG